MSNMHARHRVLLAATMTVATLSAGAAASGLNGADAGDRARPQCTASLDPDTVPVQTEPIVVGYAVPDSLGTITAITPAEDSGIVPGNIDAEAQTVVLRTASASAGDWAITFMGEAGRTCLGTLTVASIGER
jgi:hypothetical protein